MDWPIRYADLAPWYDYVERFAGIAGNRDGLDVLPDGQYLPAIDLNIVEKDVAARIQKAFGGKRHLIAGRTANITVPKPEQNRGELPVPQQMLVGLSIWCIFQHSVGNIAAPR